MTIACFNCQEDLTDEQTTENEDKVLCVLCKQKIETGATENIEETDDEGYDSHLFLNFYDLYECSLCLQALKSPVQLLEYGHVFCAACLNKATDGQDKKICPVDKREYTQSFNDQNLQRKIMSSKVKCKNKDCSWTGELFDLFDHLKKKCLKTDICCINDLCEVIIKREDVISHISTECMFRKTKCTFCEESVALCEIKDHQISVCKKIPVVCKFNCEEKVSREKVSEHEIECSLRPMKCSYSDLGCSFEGIKESMDIHLKDEVNTHLVKSVTQVDQLRKEIQLEKKRREESDEKYEALKTELNELKRDKKKSVTEFDQLKKAVQLEKDRREESDEKYEALQTEFNKLKVNSEHNKIKLESLQTLFTILQNEMQKKTTHESIWYIDQFRKEFRESQQYNHSIESPSFYSSPHGYKYELYAYLNGNGDGQNTHVSVYFGLLKGEYDGILEWPFKKKVTLSILSQDGVSSPKTCILDCDDEAFKKQTSSGNRGFGYPRMLAHDEMWRVYVKHGTMYIKCVVED